MSPMKMPRLAAVLLLASFVMGPAAVRALEPEQPPVDLLWGVKIPLRDGVELNATVYKPGGQKEPLPVVFTLTPYTADSYHDRALYFARHGFVFAMVDVRGRGNSGGTLRSAGQRGTGRIRHRRVARPPAVVERQDHDVGRLLRGP